MRILAIAALLVCALPCGSMANKSKVNRAMIKAMEESVDRQLQGLFPGDPVEVLGLTQGVYVSGYGAVFMSEVNLAPFAGITPFHPAITKDETVRIREKKVARIPKLKAAMQDMLVNSAGSLDSVPDSEQVALGVSLFYWRGENTEGLPAQIVMHAQKRALVDVKTGKADKARLAAALTVEEF